jgi:hypothetical protein
MFYVLLYVSQISSGTKESCAWRRIIIIVLKLESRIILLYIEWHLRGYIMFLSDNPTESKKAIIIGINKYESGSQIPRLAGAENDAREICERLRLNGNFDISESHLLLGEDATRKKIRKALSEIFRNEKSKCDLVTFYFAGHGIIDNNTNEGYIAPYDMDPDDPYVSGITMDDLRNVISTTKNDASVIMFLDCCFAGIAAKDATRQYTIMDSPAIRNLYASQLENIIKPLKQSPSLQVGRGKIILASTEADDTAREIKECRHPGREDPHPHGAFSFHLIEGLDGKAADPDTGVITIGSIKKHIEEQMRNEGKQIPVYRIADDSGIESVKLALLQGRFKAKISETIISAEKYVKSRSGVLQLVDIQSLAEAAKQIDGLVNLDPNNGEIPILRKSIEDGINSYFEPAINWFTNNKKFARPRINEIEDGLFDKKLQDLILGLNFKDLQKMDQNRLDTLIDLCYEIVNKTEFESLDDIKLRIFQSKIRASLRRGSRAENN